MELQKITQWFKSNLTLDNLNDIIANETEKAYKLKIAVYMVINKRPDYYYAYLWFPKSMVKVIDNRLSFWFSKAMETVKIFVLENKTEYNLEIETFKESVTK